MFEHLKAGMDIPIGNIKAKRNFIGLMFGEMVLKNQLKDDRGLKKTTYR
jgi:hypothetical protein